MFSQAPGVLKPPLVVIPAYRAAQYLPELLDRLAKIHPPEHTLAVNDGSPDNTAAVLARSGVRYLSHSRNQGKGTALKNGCRWAKAHGYRAVVSMDADLQHAPEELVGLLVAHAKNPAAVIIGSRMIDHRVMPWDRMLSNNLTSIIISVYCGQRVRDSQSGYRLIPLDAIARIPTRTVGYMYESESLQKLGALGVRLRSAPISTIYEGAVSFINPLRDSLRFIKLIWRRLWY